MNQRFGSIVTLIVRPRLLAPGAFAGWPSRAAVIRATARGLVSIYGAAVLVALVVAWRRLSISAEMPGLASIELVLLALPWSLALAHGPLVHAPLAAGAAVVVVGAVLNGLVLVSVAKAAQRMFIRRVRRNGSGADAPSRPASTGVRGGSTRGHRRE